jgi:hypothetical protein
MILPAQEQGTKSEPPPPWTPPDPLSYASRTATPQSWYEVKETFQMRDYTILPLWINPIRYRAASGEIELLEKIELRLSWPKLAADIFSVKPKSDSPSFDRLVNQIVINPPALPVYETKADTGEGYLIITPDAFLDALEPFVKMKRDQGYSVRLAPLSETKTTASEIKSFIKNAYNTWTIRPSFILLVGDTYLDSSTPFLPATTGLITGRQTDLYYATMDSPIGDVPDYVPDIQVGRLPARTQDEVSIMVDKMISYTTGGYQPWHSNASFIATCDTSYNSTEKKLNYQIAEGSHNYVINGYTKLLNFFGDFPLIDMMGGDHLYCVSFQANTNEIIPRISSGRGIITYSGHGLLNGWRDIGSISNIIIYNNDINNLPINYVYSFVASFACETNDFGSTSNLVGFGETWMLQANKGSIAFIGSAGLTQWGQDDILEKSFYDSIFENPFNPNPLREALFHGLYQVQNKYPGTALYQAQYYWETYNLLGDPSQKLWLVPGYEFEAETKTLAQDGLITNLVKYPIIITNLGNTDTYSAVILGNEWLTETNVVTYLPYHSSETLWVSVHIPESALAGESDKVDVTISSQNSDQTELFTFTTTALETFFTRFPLIFK